MISFYIAWFFRLLTEDVFITGIILFGLVFLNKKLFKNALFLILTGILYSYALKITFQIPPSQFLNIQGFALPSGHTLTRFIFYGFLTYHTESYRHLKWILFSILMLGVGHYLIFFRFHNQIDILAGYFFGLLLLIFYLYLMKQTKTTFLTTLSIFNTALIIYIFFSGFPYSLQLTYYCIFLIALASQIFRIPRQLKN